MTCRRCARAIEPDSAYCRHCGARAEGGTAARRLTRRPDAGRLGGVCAGLADYFDADVSLVRTLWVVLTIVPGILVGGVLAYLIAWVLLPAEPGPLAAGARRLVRPRAGRKLGGVCAGVASYFGVDATPVRLLWAVLTVVPVAIVPGGFLCGVLAYLVAWFIVPGEPASIPAAPPPLPPDPAPPAVD